MADKHSGYSVSSTSHLWESMQTLTLPNCPGIIATGYSRAGKATSIYFPSYNLRCDAGLPVDNAKTGETIFITHGHLDHCAALTNVLMSAKDTKPTVFVPKQIAGVIVSATCLQLYLSKGLTDVEFMAHQRTVWGRGVKSPKEKHESGTVHDIEPFESSLVVLPPTKIMKHITWVAADIGDKFNHTMNGKNCIVTIFGCMHSVKCIGYGISEVRSKLKPEYIGKTKDELDAIARSGFKLSAEQEIPILCFLLDTDHRVFENPEIFNYPCILTECTYLGDSELKKAKADKHMHWKNIEPIIRSHPENHFVLVHFSLRYSSLHITRFFESVKVDLKNVTPAFHSLTTGSSTSDGKYIECEIYDDNDGCCHSDSDETRGGAGV
jgi:ribonuclease Z